MSGTRKSIVRERCKQSLRRVFCVVATSLLLLNCTGEDLQQVTTHEAKELKILHAFPHNGQFDVAPETTIAIKFASPIDPDSLAAAWQFTEVSSGASVAGDLRIADNENTLVQFRATKTLKAGTRYRYSLSDLKAEQADQTFHGITQIFTVLSHYDDQFTVRNVFPDAPFPFVDFSPIYVNFTRILDSSSIRYGDTVKLLDEQQQLVPARVTPNKHKLTVDPIDDLTPGHHYVLQLSGVLDYSGVALAPYSREFVPRATTPRAQMPLDIVDLVDENGLTLDSPFFAQRVNSINMDSVMLGPKTVVPLSGSLIAELAYVVDFPDYTPFIIRRGGEIHGEDVPVLIGGHIPAPFDSGALNLSVLNDSIGYMYKNNVNDDKYAPRSIIMMFDAGIHMTEPQANAMITQTVLHTELTGTAEVTDGALDINVMTILENDLFRISTATASLNFHLRAPDVITKQDVADRVATTAQENKSRVFDILSAYPDNGTTEVDPDDDLTLYFNSIPDLDSLFLPGSITLEKIADIDGEITPTNIAYHLDSGGTGIRVEPSHAFDYNSRYRMTLNSSIADLHGNALIAPYIIEFDTQHFDTQQAQPAIVQSIFPGVPCTLTDIDLSNNKAGRCLGGKATDDNFDVFRMPSNRSIHILFSRPMLADSITHSDSCDQGSIRVERINDEGDCLNAVAGDYRVKNRSIEFTPHQAWEKDQLYRLILMSDDSDKRCDSGEICSAAANPLPLNTEPLNFSVGILGAGSNDDIGGPPMQIHFRGDDFKRAMFLPLFAVPNTDVNGNGRWDSTEIPHSENAINYEVTSFGGHITGANIGCDVGVETCDEFASTSFINGGLFVGVNGFDDTYQYMPIDLHVPTLTTSAITFYTEAFGLLKLQIDSGPTILRKRAVSGVIPTQLMERDGRPYVKLEVNAYVDAPYLNILGGLVNTNLRSLPIDITIAGPLEFLPDGRLAMNLVNENRVDLNLEMTGVSEQDLNQVFDPNFDPLTNLIGDIMEYLLGADREVGKITITVEPGEIQLRLVGGTLQ